MCSVHMMDCTTIEYCTAHAVASCCSARKGGCWQKISSRKLQICRNLTRQAPALSTLRRHIESVQCSQVTAVLAKKVAQHQSRKRLRPRLVSRAGQIRGGIQCIAIAIGRLRNAFYVVHVVTHDKNRPSPWVSGWV